MYFSEMKKKEEKDHVEREKWRHHQLYKSKTRVQLLGLCRTLSINTKGKLKHEIVSMIVDKQGKKLPPNKAPNELNLATLPRTTIAIGQLPICDLKHLLRQHAVCSIGSKDQLALRVFLLKHNKKEAIFAKEIASVIDTITAARELVLKEKRLHELRCTDTIPERFYSRETKRDSNITVANETLSNCISMFDDLEDYLKTRTIDENQVNRTIFSFSDTAEPSAVSTDSYSNYDDYFSVGQKIKVKWTNEDTGSSGFRPGWHVAYVNAESIENDSTSVVYLGEPDSVYEIEVSKYLNDGLIKLAN